MLGKIRQALASLLPPAEIKDVSHRLAARHIDHFRTGDYRVFLASPYFNIDLKEEIRWQKEHIRKLMHHSRKPHLFHSQFIDPNDTEIGEERKRHFHEHVILGIPFHKKILSEHELRLETIKGLMPMQTYRKLVNISMANGGTPEYFIYDKKNKEIFFVAEHIKGETRKWIELVREAGLAEVVEL